jgi:hypothetical protein
MPGYMTVEEWMLYLKPFYPNRDDDLADSLLNRFDLPFSRKLRQPSRGDALQQADAHHPNTHDAVAVLERKNAYRSSG